MSPALVESPFGVLIRRCSMRRALPYWLRVSCLAVLLLDAVVKSKWRELRETSACRTVDS